MEMKMREILTDVRQIMMMNKIIDENICKPNFCQFNIRGLCGNWKALDSFLKLYKPEVVCLQETMLSINSKFGKNPVEFKNYNLRI